MYLIPHLRCLSPHNLPGPAHANDAQPPDVTGAAVAGLTDGLGKTIFWCFDVEFLSGLSCPFESQQVMIYIFPRTGGSVSTS